MPALHPFMRKLKHIEREIDRKRILHEDNRAVVRGLDFLAREVVYGEMIGNNFVRDLDKDLNSQERRYHRAALFGAPIDQPWCITNRFLATFFCRDFTPMTRMDRIEALEGDAEVEGKMLLFDRDRCLDAVVRENVISLERIWFLLRARLLIQLGLRIRDDVIHHYRFGGYYKADSFKHFVKV